MSFGSFRFGAAVLLGQCAINSVPLLMSRWFAITGTTTSYTSTSASSAVLVWTVLMVMPSKPQFVPSAVSRLLAAQKGHGKLFNFQSWSPN